MDIEKKLKDLNLSEELATPGGVKGGNDANPSSAADVRFCFLDYFDGKKGSGGRRAIFEEHIVPFLSLEELLDCAATCCQLNSMCRTWTVGEVLEKHNIELSRHHKMELGKLVLASVSSTYTPSTVQRRYVRTATERFWARLYHPSQLEEIELAMCTYFNIHDIDCDIMSRMFDENFDWEANTDETAPVLVSAAFGDEVGGIIDVTVILRYLLMKQGNTKLSLRPPRHGPRYWYICMFGDPCEYVTKTLWITTRSADGQERVHISRRSCLRDEPQS